MVKSNFYHPSCTLEPREFSCRFTNRDKHIDHKTKKEIEETFDEAIGKAIIEGGKWVVREYTKKRISTSMELMKKAKMNRVGNLVKNPKIFFSAW